jgi:hypothetical protein
MPRPWSPLMRFVHAARFYIGLMVASPTWVRPAEAERSSKEQRQQKAQRRTTRTERS